MIDLRSDTLTKPTPAMRKAMYAAEVGDSGRLDPAGRGEDPTVNKLEDTAARLMGKEAAMFVPSGTMGNLIALLTFCSPGRRVGVEKKLHVYHNEKSAFLERPGALVPEFFETDCHSMPDLNSIKSLTAEKKITLLCLENTHNFAGGTCLAKDYIDTICSLAKENGIAVHLDGARINNAAVYLNIPVDQLVASVDTVMFCLSKGLGAPVGSMLCGEYKLISEAKKIRKLLGGTMRQAGVLAAAGLIAIEQEKQRLVEDHENARLLGANIAPNSKIALSGPDIQTNIVRIDVSASGYDAKTFLAGLEEKGLRAGAISDRFIRMVTYRGIGRDDVMQASQIINEYCASL